MMTKRKPVLLAASLAVLSLFLAGAAFAHDRSWDSRDQERGWERRESRDYGDDRFENRRDDEYDNRRGWNPSAYDGYGRGGDQYGGMSREESDLLRAQRRDIRKYAYHAQSDGRISKNEKKRLSRLQRSYQNTLDNAQYNDY